MSTTSICRLTSLALVALALTGCRDDSTGVTTPLAARLTADDAPQFSEWSAPVNIGPPVNTPFIEQAPSLSKDGLSLYFHCGNCPGDVAADLYVSQRATIDDPWGTPQRLGPNLNTASSEQGPRLSQDGHRLFFSSNRPGGSGGQDLYVARRRDKRDDFGWGPAENLGSAVNTAVDEVTPDPFEDEVTGANTIYFGSGPIGTGAIDIHVSTQLADGTYGPGAPVVELNSTSIDRQPAIGRGGLELFLASDRPGTFGTLDLWVSTRATTSEPWTTPVNLGSVVNTAVVDARPAISFKGTELYFQSPRPGGLGVFDFYVTTRTKLKGSN